MKSVLTLTLLISFLVGCSEPETVSTSILSAKVYKSEQLLDPSFYSVYFSSEQIKGPSLISPMFVKNKRKIRIGIIDTGVDFSHPLLAPFMSKLQKPEVYNRYMSHAYHGTHVAGIIALRLYEVFGPDAPEYVEFISYKFAADSIYIYNFDSTPKGVKFLYERALKDNVDILNVSFGGSLHSNQEFKILSLLAKNGTQIVAAAGNESMTSKNYYPCAYNIQNLSCIGNIDKNGTRATSSNFGKNIKLHAYGQAIFSSLPENSYGYLSGTSMSTPQVSALIAAFMITDSPVAADTIMRIGGITDKVVESPKYLSSYHY